MTTLPVPLQLARSFDCGSVHVELAYTPVSDRPHVTGRTDEDPYRDRFEFRLTNRGLPEGMVFDYLSPKPLQFFFSLVRKLEDGSLLDVTRPQVDARHSGEPRFRQMSFAQAGETLTDRISFFAFATIVPDAELVQGEYLVRIAGFEMLRVGGSACRFEPIELPLTIL